MPFAFTTLTYFKTRFTLQILVLGILLLSLIACEVEPTPSNASQSPTQRAVDNSNTPQNSAIVSPEITGVRAEATASAEWLETNWSAIGTIPYKDLFRNIDLYEGNSYGFTGKVIQVLESRGDKYQLRISVTKNRSTWSDTVYVFYEGLRILEDDLVQFVATVQGVITYKSVLGGEITIPELQSDWLKIVDESEISFLDLQNGEAIGEADPSSGPTKTSKIDTPNAEDSESPATNDPTTTANENEIIATGESFGDGIWAVSTDIQPGIYITAGNDRCSWRRVSGFSGGSSDILAIENPDERAIVEILSSDAGFSSANCGNWIPVSDVVFSDPVTEFGDGTWMVGDDIAPGIYLTLGSDRCSWRRLKSFSGGSSELLAIDNPDNRTIVEIFPSDIGFKSIMCGRWTLVEDSVLEVEILQETEFNDGTWRVGVEIAAGIYSSAGSERCSWRRLRGFSGDSSDLIAIENPRAKVLVEILPTDIGFKSIKCGSWESLSTQEP